MDVQRDRTLLYAVWWCPSYRGFDHRYNTKTQEYSWDDPTTCADDEGVGDAKASNTQDVPDDVGITKKLDVLADLTAGMYSPEVMLETLRSASMDVQVAANALLTRPDRDGSTTESSASDVPADVATKLKTLADLTAGKYSPEVMLDVLRSASGDMNVEAAANALFAQPGGNSGSTTGRRRRRRLSRRPDIEKLKANSVAVASASNALKQVGTLTNNEKNGRRRRTRRPSLRELEDKAAEVLASHKDKHESFREDVLTMERQRQRQLLERRRLKKKRRRQQIEVQAAAATVAAAAATMKREEVRLPPLADAAGDLPPQQTNNSKFCIKCGQKNNTGSRFCGQCGKDLRVAP